MKAANTTHKACPHLISLTHTDISGQSTDEDVRHPARFELPGQTGLCLLTRVVETGVGLHEAVHALVHLGGLGVDLF